MTRARLIAPLRPDKYLRIAAAMQRENMGITSGFASAAQRCPDRPGLIDELGTLTWREIDQRADALAAALQAEATPKVIGIMARNHRGFVEALIAANRIGADVLLLNTSFAGPALAEVVERERVDTVIYDEEFTATVDRALADKPDVTRIVAWTDSPSTGLTVEKMIAEHAGQAAATCRAARARSSCSPRAPPELPRAPSTPAGEAPACSRRFWTAPRGAPKNPSSSWRRCSTPGASRNSCSRPRWRAPS